MQCLGFGCCKVYNTLLDKQFIKNPDDALLLELEELSSNSEKTLSRLVQLLENEHVGFDYDKFGRALFSGLEQAYKAGSFSAGVFSERCYRLWQALPAAIDRKEPFENLLYAKEFLTCGNEQKAKDLLAEAFAFYK